MAPESLPGPALDATVEPQPRIATLIERRQVFVTVIVCLAEGSLNVSPKPLGA